MTGVVRLGTSGPEISAGCNVIITPTCLIKFYATGGACDVGSDEGKSEGKLPILVSQSINWFEPELYIKCLNVVHVLYVLCDSVHFRLYMGKIPINTKIRTGLIFENRSEA